MTTESEAYKNQYDSSSNLKARMKLFDSTSSESIWSVLWKSYNFSPNSKVLEIGAGNGEFWVHNINLIPKGLKATITDLSEGMIKEAKERIQNPDFKFQTCSACDLNFENDSFDWVLAHFMLYHLEDPKQAFNEISRVLKRDGSFGVVLYEKPKIEINRDLEIALSILPEIRDVYNRTSRMRFFAEDARKLFGEYFEYQKETISIDEKSHNDAKLLTSYIMSLPAFQTDIIPEDFSDELCSAISSEIDTNGPIVHTYKTAYMIGSKPIR